MENACSEGELNGSNNDVGRILSFAYCETFQLLAIVFSAPAYAVAFSCYIRCVCMFSVGVFCICIVCLWLSVAECVCVCVSVYLLVL